jgi:uncharacterized membrane protein
MDGLVTALTIATAVGCGLNGGVFFAFSSFVMPGLARLRPPDGVAAMQSLNVTAVTPAFMTALFGTGALCVAVIVAGLAGLDEGYGGWLVGGGALYLAGSIVVTMLYHVPRNNALAVVDPVTPEAGRLWERYLHEWTRGNHVRAAAGVAAAALLVIGVDAG